MKYRHHISVEARAIPSAAFDQICALAPAGRGPRGFRLSVDSGEPDGGQLVRSFVRLCESLGLSRKNVSTATSYGHTADRIYGTELEDAELLVLPRQVVTLRTELLSKESLALQFAAPVVVSDKARKSIEQGAFLGPLFSETRVYPKTGSGGSVVFWELFSPITLPKMSNTHQFVHPGRVQPEAFNGCYDRIIIIEDPPFNRGEPHYRRSDLQQAQVFDLAKTVEKYLEPNPGLVASNRFYKLCVQNGIDLRAAPVQIDQS